jgi:hypothetical protein
VTLVEGRNYRIAEHKTVDYYPYWMGINPQVNNPNPQKITLGNFFYTWSTNYAYPATDGGSSVTMMIDFKWQETLIIPDVASASALLDVENVVPTVFGVTSNPNPALEGTSVQLSAQFIDTGANETWQFRYRIFYPPTGWTLTPWQTVSKFDGGAKVLVLHTWGPNGANLVTQVRTKCGSFCVTLDSFDWGPTGQNTVPPLATLLKYDVLLVGTNYFVSDTAPMGNRLADYMDQGGNVVMTQFGFDNNFGCAGGICGRWDDQMYSPIPRGYSYGGAGSMGTIFVPGHPLLDGVSSMTTTAYSATITAINPGATRIVNWNDGRVLAAVNTNPKVANGARAVALNYFPVPGYGNIGGDYIQMVVNAIKWASRQPDPTIKSFPIALDPFSVMYADDVPTTTTQDSYPVIAEVRDDSDGQVRVESQTQLFSSNFDDPTQCSGSWPNPSIWPSGLFANPDGYGWMCEKNPYYTSRAASIIWYYNDPYYGTGDGTSLLYTDTYDLTTAVSAHIEFDTTWHGDGVPGPSDGYLEASTDGGATFPTVLVEYHHGSVFTGRVVLDAFSLGGYSSVVLRFRYVSSDDYGWFVDNLLIKSLVGRVVDGLGTAEGSVTVANVPPTVAGGFSSALRTEAQSLLFSGFRLSDPALVQPTEWFAYRFDFDDGSPASWVYRGSLAPPKLSVLVVHTICLGPISGTCNAGGSGQLDQLVSALLAMDDVGSVATWNFINYPFTPTAPSTAYMLGFDVIVVATNWAYFSYAPFNLARQQVGDRIADYIDAGRGGVLSMMCVYCTSGGNDLFSIRGRYMDDQYGPFKRANYVFPGAAGIDILDPSDPYSVFVGVGNGVTADVGSSFIHDGKDPLSIGGNNAAAGRNGVLLATWSADGNTAVGVKVLNNGAQTAHFGGWHAPVGVDWNMLIRNLVGFAHGGLPSPKVPDFTHTWGDNGVYTVDITAIDDDMGFLWDTAANEPVQVMSGAAMNHRFVTVSVDNTDPVIRGGIDAFIATQFCIRVSGTAGNTVTANVYVDGALAGTTSVTRDGSSPNPTTDKCGMFKLDVTAPHAVSGTLTYVQPMGGSNPTWLVFQPWREPVTPGHGTVTMKVDLATAGTVPVNLAGLKSALLDSGQGARIDFSAEAFDAGTDDLAFLWVFGAVGSTPYLTPGTPTGTYAIHVQHNDGAPVTDGTLAGTQYLGFSDPYFDRAANTGRSPVGTTAFDVRDTAVHAFDPSQPLYYVVLIVLDDDNSRGYPSHFVPHDGTDMAFVLIDLT